MSAPRQLKGAVIASKGFGHRLFAQLQLVEQRAVGSGKLAAVVLPWLEQTSNSPAKQGALTDAKLTGCLSLWNPQ